MIFEKNAEWESHLKTLGQFFLKLAAYDKHIKPQEKAS